MFNFYNYFSLDDLLTFSLQDRYRKCIRFYSEVGNNYSVSINAVYMWCNDEATIFTITNKLRLTRKKSDTMVRWWFQIRLSSIPLHWQNNWSKLWRKRMLVVDEVTFLFHLNYDLPCCSPYSCKVTKKTVAGQGNVWIERKQASFCWRFMFDNEFYLKSLNASALGNCIRP